MTVADIPAALAIWEGMPGICLFPSDCDDGLGRYLRRNPNLSVVARWDNQVVGVALAGHDGRRACLHHVAVLPNYRKRGIGRAMVNWCLRALEREGIGRCHIIVTADNADGAEFWKRLGFATKPQIELMSFTMDAERV